MKKQVKYKGFEINISRENSLGGDLYWYYHIINPDGVFIVDSFTCSDDPYKTILDDMKSTVDDYIHHPEDYTDEFD